jgi:hypothetical protein
MDIAARLAQQQQDRFIAVTIAKDERAERERRRRLAEQLLASSSPTPSQHLTEPHGEKRWRFSDVCTQRDLPPPRLTLTPTPLHTPSHASHASSPPPPDPHHFRSIHFDAVSTATSPFAVAAPTTPTPSETDAPHRRATAAALSRSYVLPTTAPRGLTLRSPPPPPTRSPPPAGPPPGLSASRSSWADQTAAAARAGRRELDAVLIRRIRESRRP